MQSGESAKKKWKLYKKRPPKKRPDILFEH